MSKGRRTGLRWHCEEHRHLRASGEGLGLEGVRSSCQRGRWKSKRKITEVIAGEGPVMWNATDQNVSQDENRRMYWHRCAPSACIHLHMRMASECACCAHSRMIC